MKQNNTPGDAKDVTAPDETMRLLVGTCAKLIQKHEGLKDVLHDHKGTIEGLAERINKLENALLHKADDNINHLHELLKSGQKINITDVPPEIKSKLNDIFKQNKNLFRDDSKN